MSIQPPHGPGFRPEPAPPGFCHRWMDDHPCGKPATWHIIWDSYLSNGLCCDEHMEEARIHWVFWAHHPYEAACSDFPHAHFSEGHNRCVIP